VKRLTLFVFICILTKWISAQEIQPSLIINTSGAITDFVVDGSKVYISTDAGTIETWNINTHQKNIYYKQADITNFMGESVPAKIFSIDKFSGKLLFVTQGNKGFRSVFIYEENSLIEIINADRNRMIVKKARWVNDSTIVLGLLSNDIIMFDVGGKKMKCEKNVSPYSFSDMSLTEKKQFIFTADESGIVHRISLQECEINQEYSGMNVDNIYQIDYQNGILITAGQDRRVGVYNTITGLSYYLQKDFLVYSSALSETGSLGAYSASEECDISVFNTKTREENYVLKGHRGVITKIIFLDEQTVLSGGDDQNLIVWKLN